ncbi:hypothetical protein, partial [Haloterrigena salina]|uniref:hypothetical protein n=1 Tax=Haloterrigena salina TaxID=504937 RepID=UPI0019552212
VQLRLSFHRTYRSLQYHSEKIDNGLLLYIGAQFLNTAAFMVAGPPGAVGSVLGSSLAIIAFARSDEERLDEENE